jgi:hypothetical protein
MEEMLKKLEMLEEIEEIEGNFKEIARRLYTKEDKIETYHIY